jgi:predicted MFS family arabinose efflux permease
MARRDGPGHIAPHHSLGGPTVPDTQPITAPAHAAAAPPAWLTPLLATACGLIAANIYYAQPLVGPIADALGLSPAAAGLIVTTTQVGYGVGLMLVVPLGDLFENRRLILMVTSLCIVALAGAAVSRTAPQFLTAALLIGLGAVSVQILVPFAAHLAPDATRGRTVGNVMAGLLLGIMLARPMGSLITHALRWQAVYVISCAATASMAIALRLLLPRRTPPPGLRYGALLGSMAVLMLTTPILRRRAFTHAFLFCVFSMFWTAAPLLLAGPDFGLSQAGIALFGLAGVAGVIAAPVAGRLADRGLSRPATAISISLCVLGFAITLAGRHVWAGGGGHTAGLAILVTAALLLDMGVSGNLVVGQRAIFALGAAYRSRLNGLYMATFFVGGAIGSALGGWAMARGGWALTGWIGVALPLVALGYFATERGGAGPAVP